jgi:hypothetical protein
MPFGSLFDACRRPVLDVEGEMTDDEINSVERNETLDHRDPRVPRALACGMHQLVTVRMYFFWTTTQVLRTACTQISPFPGDVRLFYTMTTTDPGHNATCDGTQSS